MGRDARRARRNSRSQGTSSGVGVALNTRGIDLDARLGAELSIDSHFDIMAGLITSSAEALYDDFQWQRVRFRECTLLTTDEPVYALPQTARLVSPYSLATAGRVIYPLDRRTALYLVRPGDPGPQGEIELRPTCVLSWGINWLLGANASRFICHHPGDDLTSLIGSEALPAGRTVEIGGTGKVPVSQKEIAAVLGSMRA